VTGPTGPTGGGGGGGGSFVFPTSVSVKTTSYTAVLADNGIEINFSPVGSSNLDFTIPPHSSVAFPIGAFFVVTASGITSTGNVSILGGAGVTIRGQGQSGIANISFGALVWQESQDVWVCI
jgi:hypothetical protein